MQNKLTGHLALAATGAVLSLSLGILAPQLALAEDATVSEQPSSIEQPATASRELPVSVNEETDAEKQTNTVFPEEKELALSPVEHTSSTSTPTTGTVADTPAEEVEDGIDELVPGLADGDYVISSSRIRGVLDVEGGSKKEKANVRLWDHNHTAAQSWRVATVERDGHQWRTLTNIGSNKVLTVDGDKAANSANIYQKSYDGSLSQLWAIIKNEDDTFSLWSALGNGFVADLSGGKTTPKTNLQLYRSNETVAQRFSFTSLVGKAPAKSEKLNEEFYTFKSGNKAVDVPGASKDNGRQLQAYQSNNTVAQAFYLKRDVKTGYYQLLNAGSAKAVQLDLGDILPGGAIRQQQASDSISQKWALVPSEGGWKLVSATRDDLALAFVDGKLVSQRTADATSFIVDAYRPKVAEGAYVISTAKNASYVLDVVGGSWNTGTNIQLYRSNKTAAQKWYIRTLTNGNVTLQNINSGEYVVVQKSNAQQGRQAGVLREWVVGATLGNGFEFRSALDGKVLDLNGGKVANSSNIQTYHRNLTAAQGWTLTKTSFAPNEGFYEIASTVSPMLRLAVKGASSANAANVVMATDNNQVSQLWWLKSVGNGWYALVNCNSLKVLDIKSGSAARGANVQQYTGNNSAAQKWRFEMGEYGLRIVSALGTVLDVAGAQNYSGVNVDAYTSNNTVAQGWRFQVKTAPNKLGYQNPSWMVQLSPNTVWGAWRNYGWPFNYASPSRISRTASRSECVEAFIKRAKEYLGTPYIWDYACAPGVGVDCAGLVLQCAYACGMNFGSMNPYNHYYKGLNGGYHAAYANAFWERGDLQHISSLGSRKRGDLISWPGHIAIYLGNDRMIEAAPDEGVVNRSMWRYSTPRGIIRLFN
ncbi:RICIN domain-containing protein [Atopobium sp. oral taxon 810]|uniref:RICIN domain-containing protein n=1 Tax=Atopobium sp. oral taxon 810 TaxID=712158 RepID=UPI0003979555|nr:RICIN domain-containing protein [Atopobium sp. oral taxon 810]ERI04545.1 ricin-type beta-trefoil lectin domain protein [Atopobium sp. oral taxon 810 str. F0209]